MVDPAGVEPASAMASKSSHSQVCLIYYHQLEKVDGFPCAYRPVAPHLFPGNHCDFFIFAGILPVIRYLVTRSSKTPTIKPLGRIRSDYCYWQLSF